MKIRYIFLLLLVFFAMACSNSDWEFDDYEVQGCYFPYQTPARTLILGNYDEGDNTNDNNHCFLISAVLTGVYENTETRSVYFEVDNSLLDNVANVVELPEAYYTIETTSPAIISPGETKASITVQLNDNFFEDSLSYSEVYTTNYVIPIVMTGVDNIDSLYTGIAASGVDDPDRVDEDDWEEAPKDYTLFGIKYINKYHGNYLRRGLDIITGDNPIVGREYNEDYVVDDEVVFVETCGYKKVHLENIIGRGDNSSPGNVNMELTFDDDDICNISSYDDDSYGITGTGKFVEDGDMWGNETRDVIYLDYTYTDAANSETHAVMDTLVIRDRTAVFEEYEIVLEDD
jgi:hypothetical protein